MRPTRSRSYERQARQTELLLLLVVLAVLASGGFLLLLAKTPAAPQNGERRAAPINLNTAESPQVARALSVPAPTADRIVAARTRLAGRGGFPDVDALKRLRLVVPEQIAIARDRLVVRDEAAARLQFWRVGALLAGFLVACHLLLRWLRPRSDPFLLPAVGLLCVLGVLLLFSLKDPLRDMPTYAAQVWALVIGGGLALLVALSTPFARLPLHRYGYLYAVAAVALTVLLGIFGSGPGGVKLSVAGTQPVEIIKILLVFFLAAYLAERGPLLNDPIRGLGPFPLPRRRDVLPLLLLYALPLALFALVKDLGPVLLLFGALVLLLYLATGSGAYTLFGLAATAAGGALGYALHFGVFATRVDMWLSPWRNGRVGGDHLALGLWGLASGGPWGSGLGLGAPRFVPRAGSDLAFASVGEELGLIGTFLIVVCFFVIVGRGLRIARRASTDFDRLLAAGLSGLLAIQALVILAGTLGLFPLTGVTLPFVSYGKSSLVASFFVIGVLLSLSAKTPQASTATVAPSRTYDVAMARATLVWVLLLGVVVARLLWVQGARADALMAQTVTVPDRTGARYTQINPRLRALAARIPRGRILDRAGRVLATTRATDNKRVYPFGPATVHLVGYLDPRVGGPAGLEKEHDTTLRGYGGWRELVPYWRRKDLPGLKLPRGQDITLTLDAGLQQTVLALLKSRAAAVRDRRTGKAKNRGAVVVLDVATGGILAAVTSPVFDPNTLNTTRLAAFNKNVAGDFPLINRAVWGRYPPGSTFKIVTASALFANDRADFTQNCAHAVTNVIWTADGTTYARQKIVDDESDRAHGLVNLTEAVSQSCNVYFGKAGIALGPDALRAQAETFAFSRLPTPAQFASELPDIAYGQGPLLVTPLEMAGVASAVAAGGRRLRPLLLKTAKPEIAATPLSPESAARLADMMRRVTRTGTAAGRFDALPFAVAGKTGTAQNEENDKMSHSWFIGFAPADNPRVAFAVIVENGGYGASVAAPLARDVLRAAVR